MIPASISSGLTALQAAVKAAAPINSAPTATVIALRSQAEILSAAIDAAIPNSAGTLDGVDPVGMPPVLVSAFRAIFGYARDQYALVDLDGFVGRAATNLEQLGV